MTFIVLRSSTTPKGEIVLYALSGIIQKSSGIKAEWIDFSKAITNCIAPEKCDLLSFEDKDELEQNLELWELNAENVAIIGVDPTENITNESGEI